MNKLPWMCIFWPSFLASCVLETLVFALIDPAELRWANGMDPWSSLSVYSIGFFLFWGLTLVSSATTAWLIQPKSD
jgi:hypothetical protein